MSTQLKSLHEIINEIGEEVLGEKIQANFKKTYAQYQEVKKEVSSGEGQNGLTQPVKVDLEKFQNLDQMKFIFR